MRAMTSFGTTPHDLHGFSTLYRPNALERGLPIETLAFNISDDRGLTSVAYVDINVRSRARGKLGECTRSNAGCGRES